MNNIRTYMIFFLLLCLMVPGVTLAKSERDVSLDLLDDEYEEEFYDEEVLFDPLEPMNRLFFEFNDKLYFWVLKPVKKGYSTILPE